MHTPKGELMHHTPGLAALAVANARRTRTAADRRVAQIREALDLLGKDAPARWAEAGRLRLQHPDLSLRKLGELASPPVSKHTMAALIFRLVSLAEDRRNRTAVH
jgi:DNA-binding protein WhiA